MEDSNFLLSNLSNFSSAKIKLDELFIQFLLNEGTSNIISSLSKNIKSITVDSDEDSVNGDKSSQQSSKLSATNNLIKKSPKKRTQAEMASPSVTAPSTELSRLTLSSDEHNAQQQTPVSNLTSIDQIEDHTNLKRRANFDNLPIFYVPGKRSTHLIHINEDDKLSKRLPEIEAFFKPFPGGIPMEKFVHVTKRLCGIPSFFNLPLCKRINERYGDPDSGIPAPRTIGRAGRQPSGVKIKLKSFLKFWQNEIEPFDRIERFFRIIKKHDTDYIFKDDFVPFLQELLHFHPGLDFLEQHEEFQRKYALTVITRVFYKVNTSRTGKISLHEVRKSNLFSACMHVDEETDINRVLDYFSYEHFYVIYCKFFELDSDKDSKLTKADLLKYGEHTLTETIIDRYENTISQLSSFLKF
jgi:serine/threonine-protein phosphatase 2A regulatory subunit B''